MKISFADAAIGKSGAMALVVSESANPTGFAADLDSKTAGGIKRAMKATGFTGKSGTSLELVAPQGLKVSRLVVIGAGKVADQTPTALENIGGELVARLERAKETAATVVLDGIGSAKFSEGEAAARLAFGAKLRSYRFDKYKAKKERRPERTEDAGSGQQGDERRAQILWDAGKNRRRHVPDARSRQRAAECSLPDRICQARPRAVQGRRQG
jgi:leucyl aminopeptidase